MAAPAMEEEQTGPTSVGAWLQTLNIRDYTQYSAAITSEFDSLYQLSHLWLASDGLASRENAEDGVDPVFWQVVPVTQSSERQIFANAIKELYSVYKPYRQVKRLRTSG